MKQTQQNHPENNIIISRSHNPTSLKTMNFDLALVHKLFFDKEVHNIGALIALELDHLAKIFVLDNIPITTELFLEVFEDLRVAEVLVQSFNCGYAFLAIPLLNSEMNITTFGILGLGEWIEGWCLKVYVNHELCLLKT